MIDGDASDWPDHLIHYPIAQVEWERPSGSAADFRAGFRVGYDARKQVLYAIVEIQDESTVIDTTGRRNRFSQDGCEVVLDVLHGQDHSPAAQYGVRGNQRRQRNARSEPVDWDGAEVAVRRADGVHVYEWRFDQWFGHFSQNKLYELRKLFKNNRLYFYTQFHKLL